MTNAAKEAMAGNEDDKDAALDIIRDRLQEEYVKEDIVFEKGFVSEMMEEGFTQQDAMDFIIGLLEE